MEYKFATLSVALNDGVLFLDIDNPPCNIISRDVLKELIQVADMADADDAVRVIVLQSRNRDFFIAHFDVQAVIDLPVDAGPLTPGSLGGFQRMCAQFRDHAKPSLVKIAGRVGGGGCELAASCDMRFGVRGLTVLSQMEVPLGLTPGGSGTQNLPRLMGRGRALEVILGGDDIEAATAERWGYLNRIFETVEEMDRFVDALAYRIASWPPQAVALAKQSVGNADMAWHRGLAEEHDLFSRALRHPDARKILTRFLEMGGQTHAGEMRIAQLCTDVAKSFAADTCIGGDPTG